MLIVLSVMLGIHQLNTIELAMYPLLWRTYQRIWQHWGNFLLWKIKLIEPYIVIPNDIYDTYEELSEEYGLCAELIKKDETIYIRQWGFTIHSDMLTHCWMGSGVELRRYLYDRKPRTIKIGSHFIWIFAEYSIFCAMLENTQHNLDLLRECINDRI